MINIMTRKRLTKNAVIGSPLQSQAATNIFDTHMSIVHWKSRSQIKYKTVVLTNRCG